MKHPSETMVVVSDGCSQWTKHLSEDKRSVRNLDTYLGQKIYETPPSKSGQDCRLALSELPFGITIRCETARPMKITFTFTSSADLKSTKRDDLYFSYFEVPDVVATWQDAREHVLTLAQNIGLLTQAVLHVTCKELGLKNHPVKLTYEGQYENSLVHSFNNLVLGFKSSGQSG